MTHDAGDPERTWHHIGRALKASGPLRNQIELWQYWTKQSHDAHVAEGWDERADYLEHCLKQRMSELAHNPHARNVLEAWTAETASRFREFADTARRARSQSSPAVDAQRA